jgi:integrase
MVDRRQGGGTLPIEPLKPEEKQHETKATNDHLGTAGENLVGKTIRTGGGGGEEDRMVDVDKGIERFIQTTRLRFKPAVQVEYTQRFRVFTREINLNKYSRNQLKGKAGKAVILEYLGRHPRLSWRTLISIIKSVWMYGFDLPWPIDTIRDLGRLPRTKRGESPSDEIVKRWDEAMHHEKDTYLRLLWLLIAQHGWRPSHVSKLKWSNIRYEGEKPVAIVADGQKEGFKTDAPVAARLSPDIQEALMEWMAKTPERRDDWLILPRRSPKGELLPQNTLDNQVIARYFDKLAKKWGLPHLTAKALRHWVATTCRKAGLSKQATAYLMGHDPAQGGAMRDWYDNPQLSDIFVEQAERLPYGPLGCLNPPKVEIIEGLPQEAIELLKEYLSGRMPTMEFANRMETLRFTHPILRV